MIQVQVDEEAIRQLYQKAVDSKVGELELGLVFWVSKN